MAYFVRSSQQAEATAATSHTIKIPASVENDFIVVSCTTNGAAIFSSATGNNGGTWTKQVDLFNSDELFVFTCVQGTTPDTSVTLNWTANERISVVVAVFRGVDTTTPIDTTITDNSAASASRTPASASITPTTNNCLILYCCSSDQGRNLFPPEGMQTIANQRDGGSSNTSMFYTYHPDTTATGARTFYLSDTTARKAQIATIALRDDGNGNMKGYHDLTAGAFQYLHLFGFYGSEFSDGTNYDPTTTNENISSISNGSYTNSTTIAHPQIVGTDDAVELGYISVRAGIQSSTDRGKACLSGFPISETFGSIDNYDLSGNILIANITANDANVEADNAIGLAIGLSDKTNARFWQLNTKDSTPSINSGVYPNLVDLSLTTYKMHDVGTPNLTNIGSIIICSEHTTTGNRIAIAPVSIMKTMKMQGGSSALPASFESFYDLARVGMLNTILAQGGLADNQYFIAHDTQCGGTETVYWDCSNESAEWPAAYTSTKRSFKLDAGALTHTIAPASGSTVIYDSCTLNFGNFHNFVVNSPNVSLSTDGLVVLNADVTLTAHSGAMSGISFIGCKEISKASAVDLTGGVAIKDCVDTTAITVTSEAEFQKLYNCTFTGNNRAITITGNQTGTWNTGDPNLTVSGNTYDIEYTGTTDFTIVSDNALTVNNASTGTLTIDSPTATLTVNSNVASSDIKIFTTNTQTIVASATGTTANTTTAGTYDITVQKAGYLPQRQTGVVLGASNVTVDISLVKDPIYNASHGLTFTTDYSYDASTRVMTIVANQEGRDLYSALIEDFISETSLRNCPFPLTAVGPDRIDFNAVGYYNTATTVGATIDSGDIQFWKGAGMVWEHDTTGNPTKKFYSIKSSNTLVASSVVGYTQVNNGTPVEATLVSNQVNQVIQYFEDIDGNGTADYDYTGHLVFKGFLTGYYQARWDVINDGGITSLEPYEYTINLVQEAIAGTTGNQTITITTLTDHTGAPKVVGGKNFDYELVDPGANTAENLLAQYNYDVYNAVNTSISGTLYTSYQAFDLPDLIVEAGSNYETERGYFEGDGAVTDLSGVYLSRSSSDHPDIARFQSNDGTYYTPAVVASISITNLPDDVGGDTRLQIYNVTTATEYYSGDPAGTSYSDTYTDGVGITAGDSIRIRFAHVNAGTSFELGQTFTTAATSGFTVDGNNFIAADDVYALNAVDGSAVTKFTADFTNDEIDLSANADFTSSEAYAFYCYQLTTSQGIEEFWGGISAADQANYKIVTATLSLYFDNTTTASKKQTDNARIYRDDDTYPVKEPTTSGFGIDINWKNPVYVQNVGGSALTAAESAKLTSIDSATSGLTFSKANELDVNIKSVTDVTITGSGTAVDPWGP